MAEILHTFENGRIIYKRPPKRNRKGIADARQIEQEYIKAGKPKGLKPYFMDDDGDLWEIEPKGLSKQSKNNPTGQGFRKLHLHRTHSSTHKARKNEAAFDANRFFKNFRNFPEFKDVSDDDLWDFSEKVNSMNNEELRIQQRNRKPGEHLDHRVSIKDKGLELRNNKKSIPAQDNLRKGGSSVDIETQKRIGSFVGDEEASVRGALRSPLDQPDGDNGNNGKNGKNGPKNPPKTGGSSTPKNGGKGNGSFEKGKKIARTVALANRANLPMFASIPLSLANNYLKLRKWFENPTRKNAILLGLATAESIGDVGGTVFPILEAASQIASRSQSAIEMKDALTNLQQIGAKSALLNSNRQALVGGMKQIPIPNF